jgi:hypothetical protein
MSANSDILFLDTNQYLDLYRLVPRKELLDSLQGLKEYIFVPMQIVEEVLRGKLRVADQFFSEHLKDIDTINRTLVPHHLLGIDEKKVTELRDSFSRAKDSRDELRQLAHGALNRISRSEDEVSVRFNVLFKNAISPNDTEMQRARERKERGTPPGKPNGPLGDQIIWEQLLTYCKHNDCKRLWIVAKDSDYGITSANHLFLLNALLYRDLMDACRAGLEIYSFTNLQTAITNFVDKTGVKVEKLATGEKATEIIKAIDALPRANWEEDIHERFRMYDLWRRGIGPRPPDDYIPAP